MTALAIISVILVIAAIIALVTGRQRTACAVAFVAGITIGLLAHVLGGLP